MRKEAFSKYVKRLGRIKGVSELKGSGSNGTTLSEFVFQTTR